MLERYSMQVYGKATVDHDALHPISNWFLSCRNHPVGMKIADYFNKGIW
jgi:hypothetical protein